MNRTLVVTLTAQENGDVVLRWANPDADAPEGRRAVNLIAQHGTVLNVNLGNFLVEAILAMTAPESHDCGRSVELVPGIDNKPVAIDKD